MSPHWPVTGCELSPRKRVWSRTKKLHQRAMPTEGLTADSCCQHSQQVRGLSAWAPKEVMHPGDAPHIHRSVLRAPQFYLFQIISSGKSSSRILVGFFSWGRWMEWIRIFATAAALEAATDTCCLPSLLPTVASPYPSLVRVAYLVGAN